MGSVLACGSPSSKAPEATSSSASGQSAVPEDYSVYLHSPSALDFAKTGLDNVQNLPPTQARLVGANFAIAFDAVATAKVLTAEQQDMLGYGTSLDQQPLSAGAGHEFVVTHVADALPSNGGGKAGNVPDGLAVRVGDDSREVASDFGNVLSPNSVFVVSVPVGAEVLLVITDGGHDQSINLRTGTPGSDAAGFAAIAEGGTMLKLPLQVTEPGVRLDDGTHNNAVDLSVDVHATLQVDAPGQPTAAAGRAWLVVTVAATVSDEKVVGAQLDLAKSLTLRPSGGSALPVPAKTLKSEPNNSAVPHNPRRVGDATLVFDVPRGLTGLTVSLRLDGGLFAKDDGKPLRWRNVSSDTVSETINLR